MRKKITHVINGLSLGGAETALYLLLSSMPSSHYEFCVIVLGEPGPYSTKITQLGVPIYYLAFTKTNFIKKLWQLFLLLKQIKPDIVQTWLYHSDLIGGCCAKLSGVRKIIWGIRCTGDHLKKTTQGVKILCALLSWFIPDFIVTNSKAALQHHRLVGYQGKKFRLIYNGFNPAQFYPASKLSPKIIANKRLPADAFVFGTLARFHSDKDYPNLIQAIDIVCKIRHEAYFVLCGTGCHENNKALIAKFISREYRHKIISINSIDDTTTYLNTLDIFILASKTESFPNSLAEAMLCGIPCIATDVGEVREMLGNTGGLLIDRQAPQKLAAACLAMLNKPASERQQLGAQARARIERYYSLKNNQQQIALLYE